MLDATLLLLAAIVYLWTREHTRRLHILKWIEKGCTISCLSAISRGARWHSSSKQARNKGRNASLQEKEKLLSTSSSLLSLFQFVVKFIIFAENLNLDISSFACSCVCVSLRNCYGSKINKFRLFWRFSLYYSTCLWDNSIEIYLPLRLKAMCFSCVKRKICNRSEFSFFLDEVFLSLDDFRSWLFFSFVWVILIWVFFRPFKTQMDFFWIKWFLGKQVLVRVINQLKKVSSWAKKLSPSRPKFYFNKL